MKLDRNNSENLEDQNAQQASPELEAMILKGLEGERREITPAYFDLLRAKINSARDLPKEFRKTNG